MNACTALIGSYALTGRRMFARELLEISPASAAELKDYRAESPNLTGLDLINVAAVAVREGHHIKEIA